MNRLPNLVTPRLILRALSDADAKPIAEQAGDRSIADTTISIPHPYPDGEAERYIAKQLREQKTGLGVTFGIELKSTSALIGIIELRDIEPEHSAAELSYWLTVAAWGKGYMSEAVKSLIGYGFDTLALNRIEAYHMARNIGSGKVLRKNGFKPEGLLRQRVKKWDVFEDVILLSILRHDWQNIRGE